MTKSSGKLTRPMFYILLSLADRDRHGLGVVHEVEERTEGRVKLGPARLYTSLQKLEALGMVQRTEGPSDSADDDPRRKYYGLTDSGRDALYGEAELLDSLVKIARDKRVLTARKAT